MNFMLTVFVGIASDIARSPPAAAGAMPLAQDDGQADRLASSSLRSPHRGSAPARACIRLLAVPPLEPVPFATSGP
jgi:hypothetical protein